MISSSVVMLGTRDERAWTGEALSALSCRAHSERRPSALTPLHRDGTLEAGVVHAAGVDISSLGGHFQHHENLEGPVPIPNKRGGHNAGCLLPVIPEPPNLDLARIEICHRADQQVVMV